VLQLAQRVEPRRPQSPVEAERGHEGILSRRTAFRQEVRNDPPRPAMDRGHSEAMTAFADPLSITMPDPDHSAGEERFLLVGSTAARRLVVVAHPGHGDEIRLITVRPANRHERETYEEGD